MNPKKADDQHNLDELKKYMDLPAKDKLDYLEELNKFLDTATPEKNKIIWRKLKKMGW